MIIRIIMTIINTSIITHKLVAIMIVELSSSLVDVIIGRPVELVTKWIEVVLMLIIKGYTYITIYNN